MSWSVYSVLIQTTQISPLFISGQRGDVLVCINLFQRRLTWCNSEYYDRKELWANIIKLVRYVT